jgi:hypothetical protein
LDWTTGWEIHELGVVQMLGRWVAIVAEAIRVAVSHSRRFWWRTGNRLPGASTQHLRWRLETAYGDSGISADWTDVVDFIEWRRRQRRARK